MTIPGYRAIYNVLHFGVTVTLIEEKVLMKEDKSLKEKAKMTTHKRKAVEYFNSGFLCSQAVLAAFAPECGLTEEQALKLGSCFGTGMRKGEVCGACSGALMVLGLLFGQHDCNDKESRMKINSVNDKMLERFAEINGSYLCNNLLGCDVRTKDGINYARNNHLFTEFCPKMVASAVEVLESIMEEDQANPYSSRNLLN